MRFVFALQTAPARYWRYFLTHAGKVAQRLGKRGSRAPGPAGRGDGAGILQAPLPAPANLPPQADAPACPARAAAGPPSVVSIAATLGNCTAGLKRACQDAESDFLDLGDRLQTIHADADRLTREVIDVLSPDSNETIQSALKIIQEHAEDAMQALDRQRAKLSGDISGLNAIRGDLDALGKQNNNFKRIAKNLKMVGLNISIESARSEKAKVTFQALAEEITALAQTVHSVGGLIRDDTDTARQTIDAIQKEIGGRMQHLEELLASAHTMVQTAMAEVDRLMGMTMSVLDGIGGKAADIREQVGRLVVGVQIHDNISQRVAHIESSIEEALAIMDTSCAIDSPPHAIEAVLGRVYGINRLQSAHLKTILADISDVGRQSESALDELLCAVQAVARPEGLDLSGAACGLDTSAARHPVAVLKKALEQLFSLFDEGLGDIERLNLAREQTGRTVARMEQHIEKVRDINFEIHLKALNAVIKSTQLGHTGKAIQAIVNEMKELAEQSNATIRAVAEIMESIGSASEHLDRNQQQEEDETDKAGRLLRQGIDNFTAACDLFKGQSRETLAAGGQLRDKISLSRRKIGFIDEMAAACNGYLAEFMQIDGLLKPFGEAAAEDWREEEQSILARYTMERERDAHRQAFGRPGVEVDDMQAHPAPSGIIDAGATVSEPFEDNVELF